jgi:hypothetical protein
MKYNVLIFESQGGGGEGRSGISLFLGVRV